VHVTPERVEADGGDTGWGIGVGYRFSRYVAAEFEYMDFGTSQITEYYDLSTVGLPFPTTFQPEFISEISGPAVSLLGSLPVGKSFQIFVRAGALFADRKMDTPSSLGDGPITFGDTVWLAGAGVDWSFAGRWGVRAEYQRSDEVESNILSGGSAIEWLSLRLRFDF
jgi:hypothetical protein